MHIKQTYAHRQAARNADALRSMDRRIEALEARVAALEAQGEDSSASE